MYDTITFSVHRNPKSNPDAPDTYHVRHDTIDTISREGIVEHLEKHHKLSKSVVEPVLSELAITIVEHLLFEHGYHFRNATGRGQVGHSPQYTDEQMRILLESPNKVTRVNQLGDAGH